MPESLSATLDQAGSINRKRKHLIFQLFSEFVSFKSFILPNSDLIFVVTFCAARRIPCKKILIVDFMPSK